MVYIDYANASRIADLDTVWVNGEPFKGIGYQGLLTVNTKTYVSEPTRANDGSMPNIGDHETFVVPRCKINFKYMNISDYRRLCNAIMPNEFPVTYYDKQFDEWVTHLMYCEPEEMTKIYNVGTAVIGVLDYEISFIGTLNSLPAHYVKYDANEGSIKGLKGTFSTSANYKLGDRVLYDGDYWEAIYYLDEFKGHSTDELYPYWELVGISEWNDTVSYLVGQLVFVTTTVNSNTTYTYYECVKANAGAILTDKNYWKPVTINNYSDTTTYKKGDYVYTGDRETYYRAIYFVDTFNNKNPTNISYWKKLPILSSIEVSWGQSFSLADQDDLFDPPSGKTSQDKWQVFVVKNETAVETQNFYSANQNITVFRTMVLKAVWA